jgi:protein-S-isoprenylcysteine O-methyltransferase Ste14
MKRWIIYIYGVSCHLLFFLTFAYLLGFVGNFFVPRTIDSPPAKSPATALAIDLLLITAFALQHSVMARPGFKRIWTRVIPHPAERSTYVLASCLVTMGLVWQWQAVDLVIWDVQHQVARGLLWGLFATGWFLVPAVSMMIDHFDLFGTRQAWLFLRAREYTHLPFRTPSLYKRIRHPLYVGWGIAFWSTPTMTLGHLVCAAAMTTYMALAVRWEERDLVDHFGRQYEEYRRRVPKFVPLLSRTVSTAGARALEGSILSTGSILDDERQIQTCDTEDLGQGYRDVAQPQVPSNGLHPILERGEFSQRTAGDPLNLAQIDREFHARAQGESACQGVPTVRLEPLS